MDRFDELLFEAIDDTIRLVFGESASELIYTSMERQILLKREEVGGKIEAFYAYLEKLLGSEGAQIIQTTSIKRLCLKLRREYEEIETYFSFLDELYEIKFKLLASSLKEERSKCN
ncbi:MAG: hypothetical protein ACE5K2_05995 [Candidatus Zixiibacteriota bacterium]